MPLPLSSQSQPLITLRVTTQRLAATPTRQLAQVVPYLASTLLSCEKIFQNTQASSQTKDTSEAGVLVHKLKTQISTLLNEKNPQSKWASVILIKAIIEVGGEDVLRASGAWVRGLLGILGRPDPDATKELCIITLTRIFLLTQGHQSIIREITTPSLPGFITSCLKILRAGFSTKEKVKANGFHSLSITTLNALCELVPHHPTVFRPFLTQTTTLVLRLVAPTPSNLEVCPDEITGAITTSIAEPSRRLFVLMNTCVPKNTSGEEWTKSLRAIISSMHRTADLVFRAVAEDWEPSTRPLSVNNHVTDFSKVLCDKEQNPLGLPTWKGIYAGMERLDGILQTIQVFLNTPTSATVNIPIGTILDAVTRVLSVIPPFGETGGRSDGGIQINAEIGRDEREGLWTTLPKIHVSALELLLVLISRLGYGSAALCHGVLEQALWVFEREHSDFNIRRTIYDLVSKILSLVGYSVSKSIAPLLSNCMRKCCEDILPPMNKPLSRVADPAGSKKGANNRPHISPDSYLKTSPIQPKTSDTPSAVQISAAKLLPFAITYTSRRLFNFALQAQIDRTAILTNNKQAILASVLNPPLKRPGGKTMNSIMPFLARQFPDSMEVEGLLRPRMPVLQARNDDGSGFSDQDEEPGREDDDTVLYENRVENAAVPIERRELDADLPLAQETNKSTNSVVAEIHPPPPVETRIQSLFSESQETTPLIPSKKRDRDDENSRDVEHAQTPTSPALQDVDLAPNKRARVMAEHDVATNRESEAAADQHETFTSENPVVVPETAKPSSYAHSASNPQQNFEADSDDSDDGEIPPIDPGLDTDDDDDDGDEEQG